MKKFVYKSTLEENFEKWWETTGLHCISNKEIAHKAYCAGMEDGNIEGYHEGWHEGYSTGYNEGGLFSY